MSRKHKKTRKNRRQNKKAPTKPDTGTETSIQADDITEDESSIINDASISETTKENPDVKSEESSSLPNNLSSDNDNKITSSNTVNAAKETSASENIEADLSSDERQVKNIDEPNSLQKVANSEMASAGLKAENGPIIEENRSKAVKETEAVEDTKFNKEDEDKLAKDGIEGDLQNKENTEEPDLPWSNDENNREKMPWEVEESGNKTEGHEDLNAEDHEKLNVEDQKTVLKPEDVTERLHSLVIDEKKVEVKNIEKESEGKPQSTESAEGPDKNNEPEDDDKKAVETKDNDEISVDESSGKEPVTLEKSSNLPWDESEGAEDSPMPWEESKPSAQMAGTDEEYGHIDKETGGDEEEVEDDSFLRDLSESRRAESSKKMDSQKESLLINEEQPSKPAVEDENTDKTESSQGKPAKETKTEPVENNLDFLEDDNEILLDDIMDDDLLEDEEEEVPESVGNKGKGSIKPQVASPYTAYSHAGSVISSVSERIARPLSPKMQKYVPGDRAASPSVRRPSNNYVPHTYSHTSSVNVPLRRAVSPISQFTEPPRQARVQNETSHEHRQLLEKLEEEKHRSDAYDFPDDMMSKFSPVKVKAKLPVRNIYADMEKRTKAQATYLSTPNGGGRNAPDKVLPPAATSYKSPPAVRRPLETNRYNPGRPPEANRYTGGSAAVGSEASVHSLSTAALPSVHPAPAASSAVSSAFSQTRLNTVPAKTPEPKESVQRAAPANQTTPFFSELPTPKNLSKPTPPVKNPYAAKQEIVQNHYAAKQETGHNPYAPKQEAAQNREMPTMMKMASPRSRKSTMNWYAPSNVGGHLTTPSANTNPEPVRQNVVPVPRKISLGSSQGAPPVLHVSTGATASRYTPQGGQTMGQTTGQQPIPAQQTRLTSPRTHRPRQSIDVLYDSPRVDSTVPSALTRSRIRRGSSAAPPPPANGQGGATRHMDTPISQPAPVVVHPENLVRRQWPLFSFCSSGGRFASMIPSSDGYGHRIANIKVVPLSSILRDNADELAAKFPGPLPSSGGRSVSKELGNWVNLKLKGSGKSQPAGEAVFLTIEEKIWAILRIMIEEVHGPGDFCKAGYLDRVVKVVNASCGIPKQRQKLDLVQLERAAAPGFTNSHNSNGPDSSLGVDKNGLSRIYGFLEQGETVAALEVAVSAGDWALAITLAGLLGPQALSSVVHLYSRHRFPASDPLAQNLSFFITLAGSAYLAPSLGAGKDPTLEEMKQFSAPWIVDNIESIVPFVLSNMSHPGPILFRLSTLLAEHNDCSHALLCRLLSGFPPDTPCQNVDGSIVDEIYMHILTTSRNMPASVNRQTSAQFTDAIRLLRTGYLADTGHFTEAKKYLDAVASHLSASKRQGTTQSIAVEFERLSDRLSRVPNGAKPHMSRVWDRLDKSFNKFVAGEDLSSSKQETSSEVFSNYSTPAVSRSASVMDIAANVGPQSIMNQAFPQHPAPPFVPEARPKLPNSSRSSPYLPNTANFDLTGPPGTAPHIAPGTHPSNVAQPRILGGSSHIAPPQHFDSLAHPLASAYSPPPAKIASQPPSGTYAHDYPFTSTPSSPPPRPSYPKRYASSTASDASSLARHPLAPPAYIEKPSVPRSLPKEGIPGKRVQQLAKKSVAQQKQPVAQPKLPQMKTITHQPPPPLPNIARSAEVKVRKVPSDPVSQMLEGNSKSLEPKTEIAGTPLLPMEPDHSLRNTVSGDSGTLVQEKEVANESGSNFQTTASKQALGPEAGETTKQGGEAKEKEPVTTEKEHVEEQPTEKEHVEEQPTEKEHAERQLAGKEHAEEHTEEQPVTPPAISETKQHVEEKSPLVENALKPTLSEHPNATDDVNVEQTQTLKDEPPSLKPSSLSLETPPAANSSTTIKALPRDSVSDITLPSQPEEHSVENEESQRIGIPPPTLPKPSSVRTPKNPYAALYSKAHKLSVQNKNMTYTPKSAEPAVEEEIKTPLSGTQKSSQVQLNEMGIPTDMSGVDIYGFGGYHVPPPSRENAPEPKIDLKENHTENAFEEKEPETAFDQFESINKAAASSDFGEPGSPLPSATDNIINPAANLRNIFSPPRIGNISHRSSFNSRRPSQMSSRRSSVASPLSVDDTIASKQSAIYTITEEKKLYANDADEYFDDDIVESSSEEGDSAKEREEKSKKEAAEKRKKEQERKQKEEKERKEQEQKKKKKSNASSKGWFSWLSRKDDGPKPIKAKMGEENQFYYDEKLKRWINKNAPVEEQIADTAPPPPPMKKEPDSQRIKQTSQPLPGPPRMNSPPAPNSSSISKPSLSGRPQKDENGIDGLLSLSAGLQRSKKRSRRGPRRGYVDVMALQGKK